MQSRCTMAYVMKQILEICIVCPPTKMCLEQLVDAAFQHDAIVDRHHADLWDPVPAGLPTASNAIVHDVIGHQKVCLQLCVWRYVGISKDDAAAAIVVVQSTAPIRCTSPGGWPQIPPAQSGPVHV